MDTFLQTIRRWFSVSPDVKSDFYAYTRARLTMVVGGIVIGFYFLPEMIWLLFSHPTVDQARELLIVGGGLVVVLIGVLLARRPTPATP